MMGYLAGTLENLLREGRGARAEAQDTAHQTCYQYVLIKQFLLSLQKSVLFIFCLLILLEVSFLRQFTVLNTS